MARVVIPVTEITKAGIAPATEVNGDATNNHYFANDSRTFLVVRNGGASTRTLTVKFAATVDGQAVTSRTYSLATTVTRFIGPFETGPYGTTVNVDVDHADIKLVAYRLAG